jgi:hypothetical protein
MNPPSSGPVIGPRSAGTPEMALHVLAYNLTRVMNILGVKSLIAAIQM